MALASKQKLILQLLAERGPQYGLQLVAASDGRLKKGTVYVTLARMQDKGWVAVRKGRAGQTPGKPRPQYAISAGGKKVLAAEAAWLRAMEMAT